MRLSQEAIAERLYSGPVLSDASSEVNAALEAVSPHLDHETLMALEESVNGAIGTAAEAGCLFGIRYMQNPAAFALEEE